jgi:predicted O-methyltransferase YrrM
MHETALCQIFRIREDGIYDWADTPLAKSLGVQDEDICPKAQLGMPASADLTLVFGMLDEALTCARAPRIHIASQGLEVTVDLYPSVVSLGQAVVSLPVRFEISGGVGWGPDADVFDLPIEKVFALLSKFVWTKEALAEFVGRCRALGMTDRADFLEALRLVEAAAFAWPSTSPMRCVVYSLAETLFTEGKALLVQGQPAEALQRLEAARRVTPNPIPALPYLEAVTKLAMHRPVEARVHAEAAIANGWNAEATWELMRLILPSLLAGNEGFESVRGAVQSIEGYLTPEQEVFLHDMVASLPHEAAILEIGGYRGRSTAAMAFACVGTKKRIFTVDTFFGNDGPMGRSDTFLDVWRGNLARYDLDRYVTPLPGFAHEVLVDGRHQLPCFDFAFIDGSHEFADVLRDFTLVYPMIKDGGWIALHDVEPGWPGSWRVWRQAAAPLLEKHVIVSSLSCGQKVPGRAIGVRPLPWKGYGLEWADFLVERDPRLLELAKAMQQAELLLVDEGTRNKSPQGRYVAERIGSMPDHLKKVMRCMLSKEGGTDAILWYWNALCLKHEGHLKEADMAFNAAYDLQSKPAATS